MTEHGSEFLLERCRTPLPDDLMVQLNDLIELHGARLVGWECLGQPSPDAVLGVAHAGSVDEALAILRGIVELESRFVFEVFPRGIPWLEFFELRFGTPGMVG
jgi:hypothetical protein